jgi:prepilin-type N-terminal cleavage/methylation domain-containing protein
MERYDMGELKHAHAWVRDDSSADGFSLIEVIVSTGILSVGLLSLAAYMAFGLRNMAGSSFAVLAREKAREAVESVHTARDTGQVTWALIRNESDGGRFVNGFTNLTTPGADGLVNTDDDGPIETLRTPGADGILGNADDQTLVLDNFRRQIAITDLPRDDGNGTNQALRQITVTITYTVQGLTRTYNITTYVSSYS